MDDVMRPQTLAEVMKVVRAKIETGGPHDGDETMRLASLAASLVRDSKKVTDQAVAGPWRSDSGPEGWP